MIYIPCSNFKKLILLLLLLGTSTNLFAQTLSGSAAFSYSDELSQSGTDAITQKTNTIALVKAGALFSDIFVGLAHYYDSGITEVTNKTNNTASTSSKTKVIVSGTGIGLGYHAENGLLLGVNYLLLDVQSKSNVETLKGKSAQIFDLAYRIDFDSFSIGPQFSLSIFNYETVERNGTTEDLTGTWKEQIFRPYLGIWSNM